jgi:hypothetical protein
MGKDEVDVFKLVPLAPIFGKKHPACSGITQTVGENDSCCLPLQGRDN